MQVVCSLIWEVLGSLIWEWRIALLKREASASSTAALTAGENATSGRGRMSGPLLRQGRVRISCRPQR